MNKLIKTLGIIMFITIDNIGFSAELETEFLNSSDAFSQAVIVSAKGVKTIYLSGQVGIRDGAIPDSFVEQVEIVFANIASQLDAADATLSDVIKLTGFIVDISSERLADYSSVRSKFFSSDNPPPASTLIGVSGLVFPELQVEVEAIAVIEDD